MLYPQEGYPISVMVPNVTDNQASTCLHAAAGESRVNQRLVQRSRHVREEASIINQSPSTAHCNKHQQGSPEACIQASLSPLRGKVGMSPVPQKHYLKNQSFD